MRRMAFLLLRRTLVALVLAAMGLGAYLWTGADHSLGASLNLAARFLPEGQSLETREVTGSLRAGGRIGWLRWRQGELSVEARDAELAWSLRSLIDSQLRLQRLSVRHLRIEDQRPPTPATPPGELMLPIQVEVPFEVTTLEWAGSAPVVVNGLSGKYTFDSKQHRIDAGKASISSGNYRFSGELQATAPLDLALRLQGEVLTTPPGSPHTVTLVASAEAQGALAGMGASLEVSARLEPQTQATSHAGRNGAAAGPPASTPMHATVTATHASLASRNPSPAPRPPGKASTWLRCGRRRRAPCCKARPRSPPRAMAGSDRSSLSNALPGPWDRGQLPVSRLNARARNAGAQWTIESLDAAAAGGQIQAQGEVSTAPAGANAAVAGWNGRASFRGHQSGCGRLAPGRRSAERHAVGPPGGSGLGLRDRPGRRPATRRHGGGAGARPAFEPASRPRPLGRQRPDAAQRAGADRRRATAGQPGLQHHQPLGGRPAQPEPARRHRHPGRQLRRNPGRRRAGPSAHRCRPGRALDRTLARPARRSGEGHGPGLRHPEGELARRLAEPGPAAPGAGRTVGAAPGAGRARRSCGRVLDPHGRPPGAGGLAAGAAPEHPGQGRPGRADLRGQDRGPGRASQRRHLAGPNRDPAGALAIHSSEWHLDPSARTAADRRLERCERHSHAAGLSRRAAADRADAWRSAHRMAERALEPARRRPGPLEHPGSPARTAAGLGRTPGRPGTEGAGNHRRRGARRRMGCGLGRHPARARFAGAHPGRHSGDAGRRQLQHDQRRRANGAHRPPCRQRRVRTARPVGQRARGPGPGQFHQQAQAPGRRLGLAGRHRHRRQAAGETAPPARPGGTDPAGMAHPRHAGGQRHAGRHPGRAVLGRHHRRRQPGAALGGGRPRIQPGQAARASGEAAPGPHRIQPAGRQRRGRPGRAAEPDRPCTLAAR